MEELLTTGTFRRMRSPSAVTSHAENLGEPESFVGGFENR